MMVIGKANDGRWMQNPLKTTYGQLTVMAVVLCITIVTSAGMGYMHIPFFDVVRIIIAKITGLEGWVKNGDAVLPTVITDVRLPRILASAIVGGGLAISGAVFQGILLNPLADPYTLGVSAGAAFGASLAILLNITCLWTCGIPVFAFTGAISTLGFVIYLASSNGLSGGGGGGLSSNNLILSGIIVTAILSAGISFLKYVADEQVGIIIFWLMGSFAAMTWANVTLILVFVASGFGCFVFFAKDLNAMALGNKTAASLGVDTRRVTLILLVVSSMVAAVCVSVSGIIGFVGLLVPHITRSITGPDNRKLIPVSLLCGAILLLWADTFTRAVLPVEIPIGVLTALIGGPFFCYVFRKRQLSWSGA